MGGSTFEVISDSFKAQMPQGVHPKIQGMLGDLEKIYTSLGTDADLLIKTPLLELVQRLEKKDLKPPQIMKMLQDHFEWGKMVHAGVKEGLKFEGFINESTLAKMRSMFFSELSTGHQITLKKILDQVKMVKIDLTGREEACKDITSSNVIVILSEIVQDTESLAEELLPGSEKLLKLSNYEALKLADINQNCQWAKKMVEAGKAGRVSIIPILNEKRDLLEKRLALHKMFKPLLHEAQVFIDIMPIVLTLLFEEREGIQKLRKDANAIFNEFSIGAELERLTLSLKEKLSKNRGIDELKINADAIQKNFIKQKESLNQNVLSYLRRMKIRTFIEEKLYNDAIAIGVDLTNLNSPLGMKSAPAEYSQLKVDAYHNLSSKLVDYISLVEKRVTEEGASQIRPNLKMLDQLIITVKTNIEQNHAIIPPHIAPLYAGTLNYLTESIDQTIGLFIERKNKSIGQILREPSEKEIFYKKIQEIFDHLTERFRFVKDLMAVALKMAFADQSLALKFVVYAGDETHHGDGYHALFDHSLSEFRRKRTMKSINEDDAVLFEARVVDARQAMQTFSANWPSEIFLAIKANIPK